MPNFNDSGSMGSAILFFDNIFLKYRVLEEVRMDIFLEVGLFYLFCHVVVYVIVCETIEKLFFRERRTVEPPSLREDTAGLIRFFSTLVSLPISFIAGAWFLFWMRGLSFWG